MQARASLSVEDIDNLKLYHNELKGMIKERQRGMNPDSRTTGLRLSATLMKDQISIDLSSTINDLSSPNK